MNHTDQEPGEGGSDSLFPSLRRRHGPARRIVPILLGLLAIVAIAGGAYWYLHRAPQSPPPPPPVATTPVDSTATAAAPSPAVPSLSESDSLVRRLAHDISSHPRVASWLANKDLIRRFVVAVVEVANGRSPKPRLGFMAPKGAFRVDETDSVTRIDPASYHRYDALTAAFVSLDAQGVAQLYHRIQPLCDQAYKELGLPNGTFEDALSRAFGRLLAVHVTNTLPKVVSKGALWAYADPRRESLSPAAKNLLRMGPKNALLVQAKLRALADAMGVLPQLPGAKGTGKTQ